MKLWQKIFLKRVYADAAASTPMSPSVLCELSRLFNLFGNPGALHKEAVLAKKELEFARERVARVLGAHTDEIVFTSGGTESNNIAIFGTLRALLKKHGELNVVTTPIEHASILEPLHALEDEGLYITLLPVDENGFVHAKDLREAINDETVFVSIQMVNSEIGTIQNIRELAKEVRHAKRERTPQARALRARGPSLTLAPESSLPLYFHTDASQAPLWLPLNVEKFGVDLMTLDAQKMMGPKGVGVLFVRRGIALEPLIYGGGQEKGRRSGTENVAFAGAFARALEEAQKGVEERARKIAHMRDLALVEIKKRIQGVILNGPLGEARVANNINISVPGLNGDMAVVALDAKGVAASTRSACDTDEEVVSHVLAAIGATPEVAKNSIRMTFLSTATEAQARFIAEKLFEVFLRYNQR